MLHQQTILWLCQALLQARHSPEEIYNQLFAPEKLLAGALNLSEIEKIRHDLAVIQCHGMIFSGKTPQEVYQELFGPDATNQESPWRGTLTLKEIHELYEATPAGRKSIKLEELEQVQK